MEDDLKDDLLKLVKELNDGNNWVDGAYAEYNSGTDHGMKYAADKIYELLEKHKDQSNG